MTPPGLSVERLTKTFIRGKGEIPVLSDITFSIEPEEILVILGQSGTGKTTLLNMLARLEVIDQGNISFVGKISYTPQRDLLLPWRTTLGNVYLPFEIDGTLTEAKRAAIKRLLHDFGLDEAHNAYPHELSGGMRQKVALVRALSQEASLYLFDEALSAIDFASRLSIVKNLRSFLKNEQRMGIFVTHNIEEALALADTIVVLSGHPTTVTHSIRVAISEDSRDPVTLRRNPLFQDHFDSLWHILSNL